MSGVAGVGGSHRTPGGEGWAALSREAPLLPCESTGGRSEPACSARLGPHLAALAASPFYLRTPWGGGGGPGSAPPAR